MQRRSTWRSLSLWSYRFEECAKNDVKLTAPGRLRRLCQASQRRCATDAEEWLHAPAPDRTWQFVAPLDDSGRLSDLRSSPAPPTL